MQIQTPTVNPDIGNVLTPEKLQEMVDLFVPVQTVNEVFKEWVAKGIDKVPRDAVYIVPSNVFAKLDPDPDIYCDAYAENVYLTSRNFIENPFLDNYTPLKFK